MYGPIIPGTLIANRFEIATLAGTGGMSCVYKARDLHTSRPVALKILLRTGNYGMALQRFSREAALIAEFRHPGTPSFVASGNTADGEDYLAMEWLEGETLNRRLERGLLSVRECQLLIERVAKVLASIHQLEIVHRDIKPSNLFLCDGRFERVVLLDFGVAHCRPFGRHTSLTSNGTMIGTVGYMAPEQVRDAAAITAAADIYALGLIAYECLAGRDPHPPQHAAAALARTLLEDRPGLSEVCPRVPLALSALIGRMLVKDPALRPQDGGALQRELQMLGPLHDIGDNAVTPAVPIEVNAELRLHTLVMAAEVTDEPSLDLSAGRADAVRMRQALAETLLRMGGEPLFLPEGSLLLKLPPESSIHDQAAKAARCALLIKSRWPEAEVAVATGRGQVNGPSIIGEVVDRAADLVYAGRARRQDHAQLDVVGSVWVDELSGALLERSFVILPFADGSLLTGESMSTEVIRPILGRTPPCLGREHDLGMLEMMLAHCRSESHAQAVLVTAPAGIGKTRLRQEYVLRTKGWSQPPTILLGVAQILSVGAPYAVLGDGLRRLFGILSGGNSGAANHRLLAACTEVMGESAGQQWAPLLGVLCGLRWPGPEGPELRAARSDPKVMAEQLLAAVTSLVDAWCRRGPVLWILEDLQWSDFLSLKLIGGLLRCLEDRPFMVLALARPEVKSEFPVLREWPILKEWPLGKLGRAACEKLVHCVLGDKLAPNAVTELARQADGNALLLEELIRSASQDKVPAYADTVLAMLQARLQQLELPERLMLGRASIFGESFSRGGLLALAHARNCDEVDVALEHVVKAEFIALGSRSTRAQDAEYIFRHALLREAVYNLIGDEQRRQWHADAGAYLAGTGDADALVVAEHFWRSSEPYRAAPYFTEAAKRLLEGGDQPGARSCVERGLACQAADWEAREPARLLRGQLLHLKARLLYQSLNFAASLPVGEEALRLLPAGSAQWCQAFHGQFAAAMILGSRELLRSLAGQFLAVEPKDDALAAYAESGGVLLSIYSFAGQRAAASAVLARMQSRCQRAGTDDPVAAVWMHVGELNVFRLLEGAPGLAWLAGQRSIAAAALTHSQRSICYAEAHAAICEMELGMHSGEARLRAALPLLARAVGENSHAYASAWLMLLLSRQPEHRDEAEQLAKSQLALAQQKQSGVFKGLAQLALSRVYLAMNRRSQAEETAAAALELLGEAPPLQLGAYTKLVKIRLAAGELDSARRVAQAGLSTLQALGERGWMDLALRLAAVEVEFAADRVGAGRASLRSALSLLCARAEQLPDAQRRSGYLTGLPENRRLLALGREHHLDAMPRFDSLMGLGLC